MADVRRDRAGHKSKAAPARKRSTRRTVTPRALATLDSNDLMQINRLYGMMEMKQVEIKALDAHFLQMTKDIKEKYGLVEANITIDFQTGKITKARSNDE